MADLAISSTEVLPDSTVQPDRGRNAGESISAGQVVYLDSGVYKLADSDNTEAIANAIGIALNDASTGQPVAVQKGGSPTLGASANILQGGTYMLSDTPGGLKSTTEVDAGDYITMMGVGTSNKIKLSIHVSGIQTTT